MDVVPSLSALSTSALLTQVRGLEATIARCIDESRTLTSRKDALLVELGAVSDALEELHKCRMQLEDMREDILDEVHEQLPPEISHQFEKPQPQPPSTAPQPPQLLQPPQPPPPQPPLQPPPPREQRPKHTEAKTKKTKQAPKGGGGRASAEVKAQRRAAALPSDDAERAALMLSLIHI